MYFTIQVKNCNISPYPEKRQICAYLEISYGNSKSDGLGDVVKLFVFQQVADNEVKIRYSRDMYEFCVAHFTGVEGEGKMLSCHFIWSKEDLEGFRANTVDDGPSKIKDIRKLHQIITAHKQCNDIFTRDYACLCNG